MQTGWGVQGPWDIQALTTETGPARSVKCEISEAVEANSWLIGQIINRNLNYNFHSFIVKSSFLKGVFWEERRALKQGVQTDGELRCCRYRQYSIPPNWHSTTLSQLFIKVLSLCHIHHLSKHTSCCVLLRRVPMETRWRRRRCTEEVRALLHFCRSPRLHQGCNHLTSIISSRTWLY